MITLKLNGGADNAHQTFSAQLGENFLEFTLNYVTVEGPAWSLDIHQDGELLVAGAMLEPDSQINEGLDNNIGRFFFVGDDVTLDNLGTSNSLVWVPNDV